MSKSRGGLGRGLAALIPTGPATNTVSDILIGPGVAGPPSVSDARAAGSDAAPDSGAEHPPAPSQNASASTDTGTDTDTVTDAADRATDPARRSVGDDPATIGSAAPDRRSATDGSDAPHYEEIPLAQIRPNPRNPRTVFDEEALDELAHSIREFGLLQPVVVRPLDGAENGLSASSAGGADDSGSHGSDSHGSDSHQGGYELVMGERRWRAAQRAGVETIAAIVRRTEDADLLRDALLENIHRSNLNPLEEAAAYQQLLAEFDVTHEELATRLGRSRPVISNTIRLLGLPVPVQRRVAAGVLSAGHARALLSLSDPGDQEDLAARIVAEGLSVRGTEEAVTLMGRRTPSRSRSTPKRMTMPGVEELATRLSDAYDTKVRVELGRRKGKIVVEFATVDDLERLIAIMAPTVSQKYGHRPQDVPSR